MRTRWALVSLALAACGPVTHGTDGGLDAEASVDASADTSDVTLGPVQVLMDFSHAHGFYTSPFPGEDRRRADDSLALDDAPNPSSDQLMGQVLAILRSDTRGFGTTSGIYFQLSGAIDVTHLPDVHGSLRADASVFLLSVDRAAPDYLHRVPVSVAYEDDGGPYGAHHLLSALPQQGIPLRPGTLYAAVVRRAVGDTRGLPLDVAPEMAQLAAGARPDSLPASAYPQYVTALAALHEAGVDAGDIAGLTVFRTDVPMRDFIAVRDDMLAHPVPMPDAPFVRNEVFPDYCVYQSTIHMPVYQSGTPPYDTTGGGWTFDAMHHPVVQRQEQANFVVTVPRSAMPAAGFPTTVLIRTGAGGDRPLVDRGVQLVHGGPSITPGTGPAIHFARAGFAGATVDGPLGGLRNTTHGDEQFLVFNVANPLALRDNVRQSALEIILLAHILDGVTIDASDCPGVTVAGGGRVHFDTGTLALMGHSMGATIAPLALALEPRYRAVILSGAGGSWIENVVFKQSPVPVRPVLELLLHYSSRTLREHDVALNLLQWAGEPADPPVFAPYIVREPMAGSSPRHVLMVQGIVDTYILPPIANSTSLSLGLDLAGTELDGTEPRLAQFTPLGTLLDLSGRSAIALPAQGNVTVGSLTSTAVVVQAPQDMVEDGHEVIFQTESPMRQYRCFLASLLTGTPRVPANGGAQLDPCN